MLTEVVSSAVHQTAHRQQVENDVGDSLTIGMSARVLGDFSLSRYHLLAFTCIGSNNRGVRVDVIKQENFLALSKANPDFLIEELRSRLSSPDLPALDLERLIAISAALRQCPLGGFSTLSFIYMGPSQVPPLPAFYALLVREDSLHQPFAQAAVHELQGSEQEVALQLARLGWAVGGVNPFRAEEGLSAETVSNLFAAHFGYQCGYLEVNGRGFCVPPSFYLEQNIPNPFNGPTCIKFSLERPSSASYSIFNVLGSIVWNGFLVELSAGEHFLTLDFEKLGIGGGVYFFNLKVGNEGRTIKLVYLP